MVSRRARRVADTKIDDPDDIQPRRVDVFAHFHSFLRTVTKQGFPHNVGTGQSLAPGQRVERALSFWPQTNRQSHRTLVIHTSITQTPTNQIPEERSRMTGMED